MLIDTHAHLDDDQFDADRDKVIARSFSGGIKRIINVGAGIGSSRRSVKLAEENEKIFASVGLHPHYFMKHKNFAREYQKELIDLAKNKKTVAIGEIGLDYFFHGENLSNEEKEIYNVFGFACEFFAKLRILCGDSDRTCIQMTFSHHDTAHRD